MITATAVESLRRTGIFVLGPLDRLKIMDAAAYLLTREVFVDAHIPQTARQRGVMPKPRFLADKSECVCTTLRDAILAPHLFEIALGLTDIAAAYLGRDPPVAYSTNAFWTRPGPGAPRDDIQGFHQDKDDVRFLAMFVYLTDVTTDADGPHELQGPDDITYPVYGPAGTRFLADTSHMHRGRKPRTKERGIWWWRWGVSDRPPANVWDKNEPIPAAELGDRYPDSSRLRESIKLLARP